MVGVWTRSMWASIGLGQGLARWPETHSKWMLNILRFKKNAPVYCMLEHSSLEVCATEIMGTWTMLTISHQQKNLWCQSFMLRMLFVIHNPATPFALRGGLIKQQSSTAPHVHFIIHGLGCKYLTFIQSCPLSALHFLACFIWRDNLLLYILTQQSQCSDGCGGFPQTLP